MATPRRRPAGAGSVPAAAGRAGQPVVPHHHHPARGLSPDSEREHRGRIQLPYAPEGHARLVFRPADRRRGDATARTTQYFPMPYNFDYHVTLYARFMTDARAAVGRHARHRARTCRRSSATLTSPRTAPSGRCSSWAARNWAMARTKTTSACSRCTYLIRVFSELVQGVQSMAAYGGTLVPVNTVNFDLESTATLTDITMNTPAEIESHRGILNVGAASSFNAGIAADG